MAVFLCIYLHYRINKQRDTLFEFSSVLSTVDRSKHLITSLIIRNSYSSSILTFSVFFFFFGNRVWLNRYDRAPSGNELFKAVFTLGARAPPAQNGVVFRHWEPDIFFLGSVPEYKVETLYSGTGTVPEFWRGFLKKGVFTLVPIKNRSRAPCSGTKS